MSRRQGWAFGLLVMVVATPLSAQTMRDFEYGRPLRGEKQLRAVIEFAAGVLELKPGPENRLYHFGLSYDAERFRPIGDYAFVATEPVEPLGPPAPVGNLLEHHERAGIQLRVLPNLWEFWDEVIVSTLDFSGIRLRNARPRPARG